MNNILLKECGEFISEKISVKDITIRNYISTDNMLPNKQGICDAVRLPPVEYVSHYKKNDILLSNIRPYFKKIWMATFDGGCSTDVLVFRTNSNFSPDYMRYCLSNDSFFDYTMSGVKGSKMPRGDKNYMLNYPIRNIPLSEQTAIAKVLSSIDDKIALNNKINSELEQMAKTLYDYWFIQFEFPDGNGGAYKSSNGPMTYNEVLKREIPVGWEVKKLGDLVIKNHNKSFKDGNKKLIDLSIMPENTFCINSYNKGDAFETNQFELKKYDILFGSIRPYLKKAGFAPFDGLYSGTIHSFRPKNENWFNYILLAITNNSAFNFAISASKGTKMPVIGYDDLMKYKLPFNERIVEEFNKLISFKEVIAKNILENHKLEQLRDFLLPMLMNGQIKVEQ